MTKPSILRNVGILWMIIAAVSFLSGNPILGGAAFVIGLLLIMRWRRAQR